MKQFILLLAALVIATAGFSQRVVQQIDELVNDYHEHNNFNGAVVVARDGEILYARGFGYANYELGVENTPDTRFRIASVSKQFTAMLVMQKVAEGKMDLHSSIGDYFPGYPEPHASKITIHHLLSHTSGMPHYAAIPEFFPDYSRQPWDHADFIKLFWDLDLQSEPGERYSYSSFGYYLLGHILELVSGKDFDKLLEERILHPLGMYDTGIDGHISILKNRANGYDHSLASLLNAEFRDMSTALATGDMYTTVNDIVLWDKALYDNTLLDDKHQSLIFSPNLSNYGYGWFIRHNEINDDLTLLTHSHSGGTNGFNCLTTRLPEDRYLITVLSNARPGPTTSITNNIINILYDQPVDFSRSSAIATSRVLEEEGVDNAVEYFRYLFNNHPDTYDVRTGQLSRIVSDLIGLDRAEEAVDFAKLAVEFEPESANAYMLAGGAYQAAGDNRKAVENYAKGLLIDPGHRGILGRLRRLE